MCPLFNQSYESDGIRRTYRPPETPDKPAQQSAVKAAADYYFALYKQDEAKREAEEKRRLDKQRQRQQAEREAAHRKQVAERQAQFLLEAALEEDLRDRLGL